MVYFDAYTDIGPRPAKHPAEQWSLAHLEAEMEHCAIGSALVAGTQTRLYDPHWANLEHARLLSGKPRLHAIWNAMPDVTDEFPSPEALLILMREHGVRAISLSPKTNGWDLHAPSSEPLIALLEREQILTYLPRCELADFASLRDFLKRWPRLLLIVPGTSWHEQRFLLPLLQTYRNLHITFDHLQIHYGIEDLVEKGLEDQLLYASYAPRMSMGAHRCYIDYADVSPEVKAKIAHGNLSRLLGGIEAQPPAPVPNDDLLMQTARRGEPLPCDLLDLHMHILHEGLHGGGGSYRMRHGGPAGVHRLLQRLGCKGGGFMSWNGTVCGDTRGGNACTKAALDALPDSYWGLGSFDPTHYTPGELRSAICELYADKRFIGMKPYHVHNVSYDHPSYAAWWEYGNERGYYALIHRTRADYSEVTTLAERYPNVNWVVAHCGSSYAAADGAIAAIRRFPNIYAEITMTPVWLGVIDYLAETCGSDRVLYGSDLPMRDPRQQLGWVVYSRLPLASKLRILGGNTRTLISPLRS